ncbi:unnamed protein product, partial [Mesorhabditis belari]|uniref:Protection of telomeres protein 1 n=1 Tax=Mesorhabditis belari TaxID=2138241 RepID=A0AAF3EC59_9BILA
MVEYVKLNELKETAKNERVNIWAVVRSVRQVSPDSAVVLLTDETSPSALCYIDVGRSEREHKDVRSLHLHLKEGCVVRLHRAKVTREPSNCLVVRVRSDSANGSIVIYEPGNNNPDTYDYTNFRSYTIEHHEYSLFADLVSYRESIPRRGRISFAAPANTDGFTTLNMFRPKTFQNLCVQVHSIFLTKKNETCVIRCWDGTDLNGEMVRQIGSINLTLELIPSEDIGSYWAKYHPTIDAISKKRCVDISCYTLLDQIRTLKSGDFVELHNVDYRQPQTCETAFLKLPEDRANRSKVVPILNAENHPRAEETKKRIDTLLGEYLSKNQAPPPEDENEDLSHAVLDTQATDLSSMSLFNAMCGGGQENVEPNAKMSPNAQSVGEQTSTTGDFNIEPSLAETPAQEQEELSFIKTESHVSSSRTVSARATPEANKSDVNETQQRKRSTMVTRNTLKNEAVTPQHISVPVSTRHMQIQVKQRVSEVTTVALGEEASGKAKEPAIGSTHATRSKGPPQPAFTESPSTSLKMVVHQTASQVNVTKRKNKSAIPAQIEEERSKTLVETTVKNLVAKDKPVSITKDTNDQANVQEKATEKSSPKRAAVAVNNQSSPAAKKRNTQVTTEETTADVEQPAHNAEILMKKRGRPSNKYVEARKAAEVETGAQEPSTSAAQPSNDNEAAPTKAPSPSKTPTKAPSPSKTPTKAPSPSKAPTADKNAQQQPEQPSMDIAQDENPLQNVNVKGSIRGTDDFDEEDEEFDADVAQLITEHFATKLHMEIGLPELPTWDEEARATMKMSVGEVAWLSNWLKPASDLLQSPLFMGPIKGLTIGWALRCTRCLQQIAIERRESAKSCFCPYCFKGKSLLYPCEIIYRFLVPVWFTDEENRDRVFYARIDHLTLQACDPHFRWFDAKEIGTLIEKTPEEWALIRDAIIKHAAGILGNFNLLLNKSIVRGHPKDAIGTTVLLDVLDCRVQKPAVAK